MKRIAIIGSGGAGKSTLSRQLGTALNMPVYHLDTLYWKPDYQRTPDEEWSVIQSDLCDLDKWIIDGNYNKTLDIRFEKADTIIFIDAHRITCLYRIFKRYITYRKSSRPDMGAGCHERLKWDFIKWVWNYPKNNRPHVLERLDTLSMNKIVIVLKSNRDISRILKGESSVKDSA